MSVADATKALSINYNSLYRWISEYEECGEKFIPCHGTALYSCQYEIKKLRYESPEQAQKEIFKYIELYYNTKRMHSSLGYISSQ